MVLFHNDYLTSDIMKIIYFVKWLRLKVNKNYIQIKVKHIKNMGPNDWPYGLRQRQKIL